MLEVKVIVDATPELAGVINSLAAALASKAPQSQPAPMPQSRAPMPQPPIPAQMPVPTTPAPMPSAPVQTTPMQFQTPAAPVQPQQSAAPVQAPAAPINGAPLANAPQFTVDQIMAAGATLMDAGKIEDLMNLLHSFGVQAVMELKPEQLGAFATEMRKLGAAI